MVFNIFGVAIDLSAFRIPFSVAIAVVALLLVFFITSKVVRVVLVVVFLVAIGLIGWWALQSLGFLP